MTTNDRFDRDLERWLEAAAPPSAPAELHDAAIDRARRSRQRPGWLIAARGDTFGATPKRHSTNVRLTYVLVVLGLVLVSVVGALAAGAFRSDPPLPVRQSGLVAFSAWDRPNRGVDHIHVINPDGSDDRNIGQGTCPRFSWNGSVLAWYSGVGPPAELNVAAPDGSSAKVVASVGGESRFTNYTLSPDGTRVAWFKAASTTDSLELWAAPVDGGPGTRVFAGSAGESYLSPRWSPDGHRIAFIGQTTIVNGDNAGSFRSAIYVVGTDGSDLRLVSSRPSWDEAIVWSPDSRSIAYIGLPDGSALPSIGPADAGPFQPEDVFTVGLDGTGDRNLTSSPEHEASPLWSPDGTHLAYQSFGSGEIVRLTILRVERLIPSGAPLVGPSSGGFAWSPDGSRLLFVQTSAFPSRASTLNSIDRDMRETPVVVLQRDTGIGCVAWQRTDP
jgi:WD40 repeat protein